MKWRLDPQRTGLLIIDLQEKLMPAMADQERVIQKTCQMAEIARMFEIPVFVTEQAPDKLGSTIQPLRNVLGDFKPFSKLSFSAASVLPDELPRRLLVAGVETHVCIRQTIYDLRAKDRFIHLLGDAASSRHSLDHEMALQELRQDGVLVTSVEAAAWEMLGSSEHPHFKKVSALLK